MTERPILMSAPMIRALLAGAKTQTRRAIKGRALEWLHPDMFQPDFVASPENHLCPYGVPGDRLWVRETWQGPIMSADEWETHGNDDPGSLPSRFNSPNYCEYAADGGPPPEFMTADDDLVCRWRPSIHMPRWASRILLEVTDVRVERLQDISEADALAEGIEYLPRMEGYGLPDGSHFHCTDPRISYWSLWDAINGQGSVEANPWVWAVSFRRTTP